MNCRHCALPLELCVLDLGSAPPSNAYLDEPALRGPETWYPLRLLVCQRCWLVQTEDHAGREELFRADYAYFSSYSSSWLAHAKAYAAAMQERFALSSASRVAEVAANDGYLLQYVAQLGIPCYGIEPTASTAAAARARGIDVIERFFGLSLARELAGLGMQADLIAANNVLAHVPDINDFASGFAQLLKPGGVATFEFPHLLRMLAENQFDTVYHEHYSYLSLTAVQRIFAAGGLAIFDVEELPTHGGSLRVYAQRSDRGARRSEPSVAALLRRESDAGVRTPAYYREFQSRADQLKNAFLDFLLDARRRGKSVVGYGAAAKGNTLLNYAGVRADLLAFVADRNPTKQHRYLPGSRIPIVPEQQLRERRPDYVVILPWNLRAEIMEQLEYVRGWGGCFVTAVPELKCEP